MRFTIKYLDLFRIESETYNFYIDQCFISNFCYTKVIFQILLSLACIHAAEKASPLLNVGLYTLISYSATKCVLRTDLRKPLDLNDIYAIVHIYLDLTHGLMMPIKCFTIVLCKRLSDTVVNHYNYSEKSDISMPLWVDVRLTKARIL